MKVLVVSSISPYPKNVGKKIMLGGICDYLKESPEVKFICYASFVDDPRTTGMSFSTVLPRPSTLRKLANVLWYSVVLQTKSLQESFFWNPEAGRRLDLLIGVVKPDLILYDTLRTGQYSWRHADAGMQIIYMDDLFSVRYGKMLDAIKQHCLAGVNAMGNFGDNIPGFLLKLYEKLPALQTMLLKVERRLIAASEDRAPGQFDRALLVSRVEGEILRDRTDAKNVYAIPPRMDAVPMSTRVWHGRPEFVFLGSLNLAHNTMSLESFLERNLDDLIEKIPNVQISVIGGGAGQKLKDIAARYPQHVVLHGFVEDLDAVLLRACAMISPLAFGSGIKLKVIDSLRCGMPLITTPHGIEGIEMGGSGVRLVEDDRAFIGEMEGMLDPATNREASCDNALLYETYYSQVAVDRVYSNILLSLGSYRTDHAPLAENVVSAA